MIKRLPLLFLFVAICVPIARAQNNINATDCSQAALTTAWNSMIAGANVINIPSCAAGGTGTYSTQFNVTVPSNVTSVTIKGNTTVNCTGTHGTASFACPATDTTVLVDQFASPEQPIWNINTGGASTVVRITGITFQGGTLANGNNKSNGFITFSGSTSSLRVDHCHFNATTYSINDFGGGVTINSRMQGVFDHNLWTLNGQENGVRYYPENPGNTSWSQSTNFGTSDFIFIEDSYFTGGFLNDCDRGGRQVARYNTLNADVNDSSGDSGSIQTHVVGQGVANNRGCRASERYHNYIVDPTPSFTEFGAQDGNAGTGLVYSNTISSGYQHDLIFQYSGREVSANNCGHSGGGPTWCAPPGGFGYCGTGSTGSTSVWDGNSSSGGNSTGYPCIGQTGRGQGDLLSGSGPFTNTTTGTATWPHEKLEPWYVWSETVSSGSVFATQTFNGVVPLVNQDFYVQDSVHCPAGGTSCTAGVGVGTHAQRPANCTAGPGGTFNLSPTGSYGVGYFATDDNSGNGELYVCTSANTWTAVYQPFTYPHPLVTGGSSGITLNPTSLTFASQAVGTTSAAQTFTATNSSASTVTISSITASGDFAQTNNCPASLAANASCTVSVTFTPTTTGTRTGTVVIANSSGNVTETLTGTGGVNCVTSNGSSWTTGNAFTAQNGNFSSVPFTITPNGVGTTSMGLSQSSNANSTGLNSAFIVQGSDGLWQTFSSGNVFTDIPNAHWSTGRADTFVWTVNVPAKTFSVTVTSPGACASGCSSATLGFSSSATTLGFWNLSPNSPSPSSGSLTVCGFGIASNPTVSLNPTSLTFPSLVVGAMSSAQTFVLTNNGPGSLIISTITLTGDYAQTNNCPLGSGMAPNATCTFNVSFAPTGLGTRSGTITIVSNATNTPSVESLTGTGVITCTLQNGAIISNGASISQ